MQLSPSVRLFSILQKLWLTHWPAAGLNMAEPCSTGIGGDMFCLFYDAKTRKISAMNGSGRSGAKCTLEQIRKDIGLSAGQTGVKIPLNSVHSVTVPGAPAGWVDTVERFGSGKVTMEQILAPAIEMGENGFPVSEIAGYHVRFFFPHGYCKYIC
jgi:gamma-glutamyltranspeptidase / glutathione hydrolase